MAVAVFGIRGTDPLTLGVVAGSLLAVSVAAAILPAVQATRIAPTETLTAE